MLTIVGIFVGAAVVATWLFRDDGATEHDDFQPAHAAQPGVAGGDADAAVDSPVAFAVPVPLPPGVAFTPEELIDNPDCNFTAGLGRAADTAVYVLSEAGGARFAVLDGEGTVFADELPFDPNHYRLGKRPDGSVVVALADLRMNSKMSRPVDAPEPIRVYRDGQLIFEDDKVWQFGVASDGSSFYVIEPLAGAASRLIVRNLDDGQEHQYDLGSVFNAFDAYEIPYVSFYSTTAAEVMFWPPQEVNATPRGDYWFYPVEGGGPRVIRMVPEGIPPDRSAAANAVDPQMVYSESIGGIAQPAPLGGWFHNTTDRVYFASSNVAYHLVGGDIRSSSGPFTVVKREYRGYGTAGGPRSNEVWSREIRASRIGGMVLSNNGAWLALKFGSRVWALDADSGDLVFAFPSTENAGLRVPEDSRHVVVPGRELNYLQQAWAAAALERLRGVLGPEAGVEAVGGLGGIGFRGDRLMLYRSVGRSGGRPRRYYDVFDLATVGIDGPPEFRAEADHGCGAGDFVRGLQVHDGRLTYLTTRR